jgi:hypothetical protein
MSQPEVPEPVKPVAAVFSADVEGIAQAAVRLEEIAGQLDYISEEMSFDQTEYYRDEMGGPLVKRFFASERLIDPADLVGIKKECWRLEKEFTAGDRRMVNIDPGYVSADKLVLATGKSSACRIYLGQGVWADLTLIYQNGDFRTMPWTYPDYASDPVRRVMTDVRKKYLNQLRQRKQE